MHSRVSLIASACVTAHFAIKPQVKPMAKTIGVPIGNRSLGRDSPGIVPWRFIHAKHNLESRKPPMKVTLEQLTKAACILGLGYAMTASALAINFQTDHVLVNYEGISDAYGQAVAKTVAAARTIAAEQFGFDMPETLFVSVSSKGGQRTRLYNDGQDHIFLTVPSEASLRRPAATGVFHLYG